MGTGRPSWLVMLGFHRCLWLVVLGPHRHLHVVVLGPCLLFVVLVPRCQLQVVLLGPCHFLWVEGLGTGCIVHGWWCCALIGFHVAWPPVTIMVVLSSLKGEGCGSFVSVDTPSVVILHWHPASFLCAVIMCPCSHVSSSLLHVPHHCHVSSPCCCPLPSLLISCDVVVAMPSL